MQCADVESHLTEYVDEACAADVAGAVRAHLAGCEACREMERDERSGRDAVRAHRAALFEPAPFALRARIGRDVAVVPASPRVRRWVPLAAAAAVLLAAGVLIVGLLEPVPVFAAQLAFDHMKCTHLGPTSGSADAAALEREWKNWQGWNLRIPTGRQAGGLVLRGFRRCLTSEGGMAHLLYDHHGEGVSVFVLPDEARFGPGVLEVFGHEAVMWRSGGHTYALVAKGTRADVTAMARALEAELAAGGA